MTDSAGFVGRQPELRVLDELLAAARSGDPQVVYVEAEPGSGKSTLLAHFLGSLPDAAVLVASGDEEETLLAFGVVDQLLAVPADAGTDPMVVGAQLLDRFDQLQADGRVLVVAIDDLQWADRQSSRAVLFALRRLRADKVFTLVSCRTGDMTDPGWARFVAGDSRVTRLRLAGLSPDNLKELALTLGLGRLSDRGASRLVAHTEGNALYCRALLDEIGVESLNAAGNDGLRAPRELSAVILARVAALAPATQTFLAAAAVLGQHAPAPTVLAVAELTDARDSLDEAAAAAILSQEPHGSELSFVHPLFRAAIYGDLSPKHRREFHARAGAVVTGRARLTHRVAASLDADDSLASELEAAAQDAAGMGESASAAWALEQAAALSTQAHDRERRLLDAVAILLNAADAPAAERLLATCDVASPRQDALIGLWGVYTGAPTAEGRLLAAWEAHDPLIEPEIGARAATSLANLTAISGRPQEGVAWATRAVTATVAGSPLRSMARTAQAYALAVAGRSAEGLDVLDFLPPAGNEVGLAETDALVMRGTLRLYSDDLSGAIADLGVGSARIRAGLPSTYPVPCVTNLSVAYTRRGDWDAAVAQAEMAISMAQDADRPLDLARAHGQAAQILALRGQWSSAQDHAAAAREASDRFPVVFAVAYSALAAATLASARGDPAGVLQAVERIHATRLVDVGGRPGIFNWKAIEVDAFIGLGRLDEAAAALDSFDAAIAAVGLPSAGLMSARCRGNLAVARGDATAAAAAFTQAHSIAPRVPMPFELALLSLDDGRRLRAANDQPGAVAHLEAAHQLFFDLGADPYVQRCALELAALRVIATTGSAATELGLSRAEIAVARLVATGLTNREVAGQLYLSVKTVEYHLRNTYLKLDISSRRELTALMR